MLAGSGWWQWMLTIRFLVNNQGGALLLLAVVRD